MGGYNLPYVALSLFKLVALFLIARPVIHQADECNSHARGAITATATALPHPLASRFLENVRVMAE